ncbi:ubiquitin-conjugating enzyme [Colletotrichum falcatum]|nr:ubiquitin-conjugating enzyme [Colletotrichum falcatum]
MSFKAKLADYMAKGKLSEDTHEPSPPRSVISPSQPTTKRTRAQKPKAREGKSVPDLPPPAMEHSSTPLEKSRQIGKKTAEASTPSAWVHDRQTDGDTETKDALVYEPCQSLPSSSSNTWFSKDNHNAPHHSHSSSPAQALVVYHHKYRVGHASPSLSSSKPPLGKPVESTKPGTSAASSSASAFHLSYDDFPAIKKTPPVNSVLTWSRSTEPAADEKGVRNSFIPTTPSEHTEIPRAHTESSPLDTGWKAMTTYQRDLIRRPPVTSRAMPLTTNAAAAPRQADSAMPGLSEEQKLRAFVQRMVRHRCPGCGTAAAHSHIGAVFGYAQKILNSTKPEPIFKCHHRRCHLFFCPACTKTGTTPRALARSSAFTPGRYTWCCPSARLFFVFLLLCGPRRHPDDGLASLLRDCQVNADTGGLEARAEAAKCLRRESGSAAIGTGYGLPGDYASTTVCEFPRAADAEDSEVLPDLFAKLREAWPSVANSSEFDRHPPELLLAMARRSPLMVKVAELLRNDCVEDVVHRAAVYQAMFDFIRVVVAHPSSAPLVRDPRTGYPLRQTLLPVCFSPDGFASSASQQAPSASSKGKEKALHEPPQDTLQSLVSLLSSLTDQSRAVMHYMDRETKDAAGVLAMCKRICDFSDGISGPPSVDAAGGTKRPGSARHPASSRVCAAATTGATVRLGEANERRAEDLRAWLGANKIAEVETEDWLERYSFSTYLALTTGGAVKPGRVKRIVFDLSALRTSLPEGIFVRHHGSRLDAMKVLIVGPEGTPYENGLFEFDLFCPLGYPDVPPTMLFKTTRSGRRFNPNLYVDGKICLSLLGTWEGERWCPQKSTLLQLLVSIQAMIFCAKPLWNEPGRDWEDWVSDLYNWEMRADTLVFAMSDWLQARETSAVNGLWDEVVGKHFELRWRRILETAIRWEKENKPEASFDRSGLGFIMRNKCAAKRFGTGIRRLKRHFAEWARTEEDKALVQIGPVQKSQAAPEHVSVADEGSTRPEGIHFRIQ